MKRLLRRNDGDADEVARDLETRTRFRKLLMLAGVGLILMVLAGWGSWGYISNWRQDRDLRKARAFETEGDYRRALLTLEQLVQIYPYNFEARRALASFYERAGQAQATERWDEVARMEPDNAQNWLGLATTAVRFRDQATAKKALSRLESLGATGVEYLRLAAASAMFSRDTAALEKNLVALAQATPGDLRIQLTLAVLQLKSDQPAKAAEARAQLIALAREPSLRMRGVVELLSDVARRWPESSKERESALRQLAVAVAPPEGPRIDFVMPTAVDRLVAYAMTQQDPKPEDTALFLAWMTANNWAREALRWLDALPAASVESPLLRPVIAEAALKVEDWTRLRKLVEQGAWGPLPIEAFDRLMKLRPAVGRSEPPGRQSWSEIIALCHSSVPGMRMLVRFSKLWNWSEEKQLALQTLTRDFPREAWAWRELVSEALARRDSALLWQTYHNRSLAIPGDTSLQVESGLIGLMIGHRSAPTVSNTRALLRREPGNDAVKILHALALWRERQFAEAAALLDAMPRASFAEPRYALVYGLVLADSNRARESQQMLNWALAERLLPEETLLLEQARVHNERRLSGATSP